MSQVKESLSIEETNKIRISIGLKPLPTPDADNTTPQELDPDQLAEQNYAKHRQDEQDAVQAKKVAERVLKAKENRERLAKLSGRGLGELAPDQEDVDDLKKWVKQHKKKSSKKHDPLLAAKKKEAELNADEVEYGSRDLEGLKVGHDLNDLQSNMMEEEKMVLTLKDSKILDGEDDELENVELAQHTRTKEAVELKRQGRQAGKYTGYDDDEFLAPGQAQTVLAKYSDTIDGKQDKSFRLGKDTSLEQDHASRPERRDGANSSKITKQETAEILKKDLLSLDYSSEVTASFKLLFSAFSLQLYMSNLRILTFHVFSFIFSETIGNDYLEEGDPGFKKKTKKSKSKKSKQRAPTSTLPDEEADNKPKDAMDIDPPNPGQLAEPDVIDDEELQVAMSRMRREAGKLRRKHQQAHQKEDAPAAPSDADHEMADALSQVEKGEEDDDDDGRLVIDDASEFIRTISLQQERLAELRRKEEAARNKPKPVSIEPSLEAIAESEPDSPIDEEAERREMERLMAGDVDRLGGDAKKENGEVQETEEDSTTYGATGAEQYVSGGMASTLSLLKSQGLIKPLTPEEREKERLYKDKMAWLIEQRRRDALRELEKEKTKKMGDAKDQATREYENRMREAAAAKEAMEAYRHYKPDVEIKYNDEFGRELTRKEAWKALSHKFHGKGSGKAKTEKRIKKIEEEKKLVSTFSPTTTNQCLLAYK
jgi:U4/U6.U5 tri-snRNP-associated protein 1